MIKDLSNGYMIRLLSERKAGHCPLFGVSICPESGRLSARLTRTIGLRSARAITTATARTTCWSGSIPPACSAITPPETCPPGPNWAAASTCPGPSSLNATGCTPCPSESPALHRHCLQCAGAEPGTVVHTPCVCCVAGGATFAALGGLASLGIFF